MQINRNNYENFFLLYADGELRADGRKAVEDFVAENEDLRIELEMLQATVLPAEEILFADKSFLYKEIIFDTKLQKKLLLKMDDELAGKELADVNTLLATNAVATEEYDLLLKTKLDATEKIIFEEKHLLYKKERDNVVVFGWLRWAAAAALIGFGLFFGLKFFGKNTMEPNTEIATKTTIETKKGNATLPIANEGNDEQNIATVIPSNNKVKESNPATKKNATIENTVADSRNEKEANKNNALQKDIQTQEINKISNTKEQEQIATINKENIIQPQRKIIVKEITQEQIASVNVTEKIKSLIVANENIVPLEDTYAKTVALSNTEKSENKILYMDEDDVKRSKAGGFFRKVKRFVTRTANIKSGNTLQIAGFEIASK
jgi:hypothetical protein